MENFNQIEKFVYDNNRSHLKTILLSCYLSTDLQPSHELQDADCAATWHHSQKYCGIINVPTLDHEATDRKQRIKIIDNTYWRLVCVSAQASHHSNNLLHTYRLIEPQNAGVCCLPRVPSAMWRLGSRPHCLRLSMATHVHWYVDVLPSATRGFVVDFKATEIELGLNMINKPAWKAILSTWKFTYSSSSFWAHDLYAFVVGVYMYKDVSKVFTYVAAQVTRYGKVRNITYKKTTWAVRWLGSGKVKDVLVNT